MARSFCLSRLPGTIALTVAVALIAGCATAPQPASKPQSQPGHTTHTESQPLVDTAPVTSAPSPDVELKPAAPARYVVKKGDTLWGIATQYLRDPWYWPEIWYANSQVDNPHRIYPGDVLALSYVNGSPRLQVADGPRVQGERVRRLSPEVRSERLAKEDFRLPIQTVRQFIIRPRVVSQEQIQQAPYIMASRDHRLVYGSGDHVYARGFEPNSKKTRYTVFRPGKKLVDPNTGELLGYEAIMIGDADVLRDGDPAIVRLSQTEREALKGDRLLPVSDEQDKAFFPRPPQRAVDGTIISLFDAISQVGQYQIVVLNRGKRNGLKKGHVLAVNQAGRVVDDPYASGERSAEVKLPEERAGLAMVFRTLDKVSYALVMEASRPIRVGDTVEQP